MVQMTMPARQKRPGGRTAEVTGRINEAILTLLIEGGIEACTFQAVAFRAGVERSTLYRRYPDKWPAIVGAMIDFANRETPAASTGSLRSDLIEVLNKIAVVLQGPVGPAFMSVAAALRTGVAPGEANRFWSSRRKILAPMIEAAVARGELPEDVDYDDLYTMAAGPVFFRTFVVSRPIDGEWIDELADAVCDRYCQKG